MLKKKINRAFSLIMVPAMAVFSFTSCMPSYPKEKLPEAIKEVCKLEYNMMVEVALEGNTLGIYYPMAGLLDAGMGISKEAWDNISNLILIASRVVLSTDADIKFYCVVTQDERLPEMQVVIIKYVDDVKHSMYQNISRGESFKRTLFTMNLTPQARKERSISDIFNKLEITESAREGIMDEFFRSPPTKLDDIGYWKGHFYLKDIRLEEFLASQIANRVKIDFRQDKDLGTLFAYGSSEGDFLSTEGGEKVFLLNFKIFDQSEDDTGLTLKKRKVEELVRIANEVVNGYKFKKFDFFELNDQVENTKVMINASDVMNFPESKDTINNIVQGSSNHF